MGYTLEEKAIGEGTYGAVYRALCSRTGRTVAIKKMKPEHEDEGVPSTAVREIAVLKAIDHKNCVKLLDIFVVRGRVNLVFEFVERNLKEYMRQHRPCLSPDVVRDFQLQLTEGTLHMHSHRIIHRDLKPQNILIDGARCLKIADFGMARAFSLPMPKYTHEVVTTWYRAPEILLGKQEYAVPIDMWSAGCILCEMAIGSTMFPGDSEIDTIFKIFKKLGTPTQADWPELHNLPDFKPSFPRWQRKPWAEIRNAAAQLGTNGTAMADELLQYDPARRLSARRALAHPYFTRSSDVAMES